MAGIYRRGGTWWGRVQRKGKEFRASLRTRSESVARKRLGEWIARLDAQAWGDRERLSLNELAARFITEHLPNVRRQTARRYGISIGHLNAAMGALQIDEITSANLVEFETARRSEGVSAPTIRRDLSCLSVMFSFAQERELLDVNPVGPFLKRAKKRGLKENESRRRYLTKAEELKLLSQATPEVRQAVAFAIGSGLRQREQFDLCWRDVDLAARTVTIHAASAKGKRTRVVALLEPAVAVLRSLPRHIKSPYVFWHDDGKPYRHLNRGLAGAARRSGIPPLVWHDLRRTHGCRLLQELKWSMEMVREQLGHSTVLQTEKAYAFLEVEHRLRRAGNCADDVPEPGSASAASGGSNQSGAAENAGGTGD